MNNPLKPGYSVLAGEMLYKMGYYPCDFNGKKIPENGLKAEDYLGVLIDGKTRPPRPLIAMIHFQGFFWEVEVYGGVDGRFSAEAQHLLYQLADSMEAKETINCFFRFIKEDRKELI